MSPNSPAMNLSQSPEKKANTLPELTIPRRQFLQTAGATATLGCAPIWAVAKEETPSTPEHLVKTLYESLNPRQKRAVCFDWNYEHPQLGLLRTRVENNWHITRPEIAGNFFTKDQQEIIRAIYEGMYHPDWISSIDKQLEDDAGGYGYDQNIAIFGTPMEDKFEFVMTGRHLTMRCDGNTTEHVAFGGPLFYGHAAQDFYEEPDHPGNVYWPQALEANKVYEMLDGKQREQALIQRLPREQQVHFQGKDGTFLGIPITELSSDQKEQAQKVLKKLLEPYRKVDRQDVRACLEKQGGLDACYLSFAKAGDLGEDKVWDNWRLEGPSFVWHFRGAPHVHVWVNVSESPNVKLNA
ncbi:DUF3500 domain-containing protein [Planctomycetales bacterium 10988]|nr:DUF3500 domain-containing protein [Planctomycetales bacterium 10988]